MNLVIAGYGRVGATLAREALAEGHAVTIIDNQSTRVQRAARLPGTKVVAGNAVDVQLQRDAGVGAADVFVAVTPNDNVNLVAAQISIEVFQVANVMARVYAPSRGEVTANRGIVTVCPTRFAIDTIRERLKEIASDAAPHSPLTPRPSREHEAVRPVDESKFVVIAGGGRVGFHLARSLLRNGHEVSLIERNPQIARELTARIDCPIVVGDGSLGAILEEAGAGRCRVFAAVTGRDEDNLVACQTVKARFSTPKTIARVSDPHNEDLYRALGVDATVSATTLIESVIERELPTLQIRTLLQLKGGGLSILELVLQESSPVVDRPLRDIVLPRDCNVVAILRGARTVVPRGDTTFKPADKVLVLVGKDSERTLEELILGAPPVAPDATPGATHGAAPDASTAHGTAQGTRETHETHETHETRETDGTHTTHETKKKG
jgi:trk system potassium uptake protein TrkA